MARSFGPARCLIALEAENTLSSLTVYLAALASGHPLLILPPGWRPSLRKAHCRL